MEIEEIKKIKEETEAQILELLDQFTVKTGLYLKEIVLLEGPRIGQLYSEVVHVEIKTALPEEVSPRRGITMEDIEKKLKEEGMSLEEIEGIKKGDDGGEKELKIEGFGDFTIVRDHPGYIDIRYKGESVRGVVGATVKAFSEDKDCAVLVLEIMENIPLMTAKKEGLLENES